MLGLALRRKRLELQAHRQWLSAFTAGGQVCTGTFETPTLATARSTSRPVIRQYHITPKHIRKRRIKEQQSLEPGLNEVADSRLLDTLRQALQDVDINGVIETFNHITDFKTLDHNVTWRLAQCIHESYRRDKRKEPKNRSVDTGELVAFAETLIKLIRQGDLTPDTRAHVHLLSFFNESGVRDSGIALWRWLEGQDDSHVSADVYGAAMELLAVHGEPLDLLEQLYESALQRFPGTFNAYHLSPNAILADRDRMVNLRGFSMVLLQGVLTARLMHGDSRNAYLALDTALRLLPAQTPPRFFSLFLDERPVAEAYAVFVMACRSGVALPYDSVRKLLTALRTSSGTDTVAGAIAALRQVTSAIYLHTLVKGSASKHQLSELIIAVTQLLRLPGAAPLDSKQKRQIVDSIMNAIRKTLDIFARYGTTPTISAFNSIIVNLAGFGQSKQIIGIALKDARALGLEQNLVTRRSVIIAAGNLGDAELVAKAWDGLVSHKLQARSTPDASDYHILIKAAKLAGAEAFAEQACKAMAAHGLHEYAQTSVYEHLHASTESQPSETSPPMDVSALLAGLDKFRADLDVFDESTSDVSAMQDFSKTRAPVLLAASPENVQLPDAEQRRLYDELTTEQTQSTAETFPEESADLSPPTLSPTNIPYGTLRYESWKTISHLLALAEKHDAAYNEAIDKAIAAGVPPPARQKVLAADLSACGLSDVGETDESILDGDELERRRREVMRLRGLAPAP